MLFEIITRVVILARRFLGTVTVSAVVSSDNCSVGYPWYLSRRYLDSLISLTPWSNILNLKRWGQGIPITSVQRQTSNPFTLCHSTFPINCLDVTLALPIPKSKSSLLYLLPFFPPSMKNWLTSRQILSPTPLLPQNRRRLFIWFYLLSSDQVSL